MSNYPSGVILLTAGDEVLLRQIPQVMVQQGGVLPSSAFFPSSKDDSGMLSSLRGAAVEPGEAASRWTGTSKLAGVWGVSVGEVTTLGLPAIDDSCLPDTPPDHASIDFNNLPSNAAHRQKGRMLKESAVERGRLFPPNE